MSRVQEVTSWRTSDGKVHATQAEASERQQQIDLWDWCRSRGIGSGGEWSAEMVADALFDDRERLLKILLGSLP